LQTPSVVTVRLAEGLSIIDETLARSDSNEERWCVAELLRIKGERIQREGAPKAAKAAEGHFLRLLDWAGRQGALSWELRTSTSLALAAGSRPYRRGPQPSAAGVRSFQRGL
jgi:hypothetical protein